MRLHQAECQAPARECGADTPHAPQGQAGWGGGVGGLCTAMLWIGGDDLGFRTPQRSRYMAPVVLWTRIARGGVAAAVEVGDARMIRDGTVAGAVRNRQRPGSSERLQGANDRRATTRQTHRLTGTVRFSKSLSELPARDCKETKALGL